MMVNVYTLPISLYVETLEPMCVLTGSGASIMSVQFDHQVDIILYMFTRVLDYFLQSRLVLAASNDYASRIWSINDQRLKVCPYNNYLLNIPLYL